MVPQKYMLLCPHIYGRKQYIVTEKRRGRVVRAARLWCRMSSLSASTRLGFGKLTLSTQQ